MAKRKIQGTEENPLTPRVRKHVESLGFRRIDGYLAWCTTHGFRAATDKSQQELHSEAAAIAAMRARSREVERLDRNPKKLIDAVCNGRILSKSLDERPQLQQFCRVIEKSRSGGGAREALAALLTKIAGETDFLLEEVIIAGGRKPFVEGLIKLNDRRGQWIRPLESWRPATHNARRQFASLARHLLARFPVPDFMDQAWFRSDTGSHRLRNWFVHIGEGKNFRSADTPIPMTKMMAHHFLAAPGDISIEGAIRWGQVHALGGDKRLVEAILGTRIGQTFADDDFWSSVIRFFIANPMLDRRHVGPIVDYLHNQRFVGRQVFMPGRGMVAEPPPQPNLSMRGRAAGVLLDRVERWHRELGRTTGTGKLQFKPSGIVPLEMTTGPEGERLWRIRELLSGAELEAEGKSMRHCVASYARSCSAGQCSIWTMELHSAKGMEKRQTLEVSRGGTVLQCRGRMNRLPTQGELQIVREWARMAGLTLSPYVRAQM